METPRRPLRVLHSFPHRLGAGRICTTAWYEVDSAVAAGADVTVIAGDSIRPFDRAVSVRTTFSRGRLTIPCRNREGSARRSACVSTGPF